jgi:N-acyl-phosphatidylethanolamine-hydrolysing phospholipase D
MAAFSSPTGADTVSRPKNRYYDPSKPHHRPDGFQNNDGDFRPKSLADVLRWRWNASRRGLPPRPGTPIPRTQPDLAFIHANARAAAAMEPAVTWIGHATVLAQLGGLNVLTDPIFSDRASPVQFAGPKRHQPPGLALAELPRIDLVVASHNHYDHLDEASIRHLNEQEGGPPLFIVPLGLKDWLQDKGVSNAVELDWWDSHRVPAPSGEVEVMLLPSQHWSSRSLDDRMLTLWGGFAVMAPDCHLFYAGDTGYSRDFKEIRKRLADKQGSGGFDIALLPIGAYEPRWFMKEQHVNVQEAVKIHQDLGAKRSLGVHWGTFELTDEALDEPPRQLVLEREAAKIADEEFFVLAIGQTRRIPRR